MRHLCGCTCLGLSLQQQEDQAREFPQVKLDKDWKKLDVCDWRRTPFPSVVLSKVKISHVCYCQYTA